MKNKKGHNWKARQVVEATVIENPSQKVSIILKVSLKLRGSRYKARS
jgi:hypothetical protein